MINAERTGAYIQTLRKEKGMTQTELGERLGLSCQAISKWERGEGLPDTSVLLDLAEILETTVDSLLRGGEVHIPFSGKLSVENILEGIHSFFTLLRLIGRDNTLYQGMIEGINRRMNLDWDEDLSGREERLVCGAVRGRGDHPRNRPWKMGGLGGSGPVVCLGKVAEQHPSLCPRCRNPVKSSCYHPLLTSFETG